jgi:hypothetical protein
MKKITGKTHGILKRLPHFYNPTSKLLLPVVEIIGRRLEQTETELYQVLRAHHVETADNEGSQGYTASLEKQGDLDKIFTLYLESLGGTSQLVKMNPRFTVRSFNIHRLARRLIEDETPFIAYLRKTLDPKTLALLERYHVSYSEYICDEEIQPQFALALLLDSSPVSKFIRHHLSPETEQLLFAYGGGKELPPRLKEHLARDLKNHILREPSFFIENYNYFKNITLSEKAKLLLNGIYRDFLQEKYQAESDEIDEIDEITRARLLKLKSLENAQPVAIPPGDDLVRLNRMLLEAAFPYNKTWGFRKRQIPTFNQMRKVLRDAFNQLLEKLENGFHAKRFPELFAECMPLKPPSPKEWIWINRRCLELAFPNEIENSYAPYRERLLHLIQVLRRGASTQQGIIDIVAANLGIIGNEPEALAAKAQIEIEEFLPKQTTLFTKPQPLNFYETFIINNNNVTAQTPEIMIRLNADNPIKTLYNIRLVAEDLGKSVCFKGKLTENDSLVFKKNAVLLNGMNFSQQLEGKLPTVSPGSSKWRFEAEIVADNGSYSAARFDVSKYDDSVFVTKGAPMVSIEVDLYRYTYGVFTVIIPWHIKGFTDKFEETADHPRHQILALVNRVKAAGVGALIAYKQIFTEKHDQSVTLGLELQGQCLKESHKITDHFEIDSRQSNRETHDMADNLVLSGRFDYTHFDSLNKFA